MSFGACAAQPRLDAREQLHHLERLGQIVVGAELQADHLVDHLAARGQHDHRRLDALLAQVAQHVEAVLPGQHHVEQQQIERLLRARAPAPRGRPCADSTTVALAPEPIAQREHQPGLVFDDQDAAPRHECGADRAHVRPSFASRRHAVRVRPHARIARPGASVGRSAGPPAQRAFRRERQVQRERAALAGVGAHRDPAAELVHDALDQAQAEPAAVDLPRRGVAAAIERLEDVRQVAGGDAGAVVADGDADLAPGALGRPAPRSTTAGGVPPYFSALTIRFCSERDTAAGIGEHRRQLARAAPLDRRVVLAHQRLGAAQRVLDDAAEIGGPHVERGAAALEAGELHDLLDHLRQPAALAGDHVAVALHLLRVGDDAVGEVLGGRADHGERRAQLVRHAGDELHLLRGEAPGAAGRDQHQPHARAEQQQHAEADEQVAQRARATRRCRASRRGAARAPSSAARRRVPRAAGTARAAATAEHVAARALAATITVSAPAAATRRAGRAARRSGARCRAAACRRAGGRLGRRSVTKRRNSKKRISNMSSR